MTHDFNNISLHIVVTGKKPKRGKSRSLSEASTISASYMKGLLENFKYNKHKSSTKAMYHAVWTQFNEFVIRLDEIPHSWEERTSMFCAYLIKEKQVQSSTLKSYVSAIKAKLTADNYDWNGNLVLLSTLTANCKKENDCVRTRLPISVKLLDLLLAEIGRILTSVYLILLYRTAFLISYYGLLRIGEITKSRHVLRAKDIHAADNKDKLLLVLYSSKMHGKGDRPQTIREHVWRPIQEFQAIQDIF